MKDWVSGEEVNCQYDALNRLVAAETTGAGWGQAFGYDGFGNLVSQTVTKGSAPSLTVAVNPASNRVVGASYDANGNLLWGGYSYDVENRLLAAPWEGEEYAYDASNRRVWKRKQVGEDQYRHEVYFYGVGGERLGTYRMVRNGAALVFETVAENLYFNGRLIRSGREVVAVDRLGSVRWRRHLETGAEQRFDYWPYGQEKPSATVQEREKFGTYYRDATGLDYADQRYYMSHWGRFLTADPFVSTTALENPTRGWNRYAYVEGDPVNFWDPAGLCAAVAGTEVCFSVTATGAAPSTPPPSVPWNLHNFPALQDFVGAPGALLMVPAFYPSEAGGGGEDRLGRARRYLRNAIDALKRALENPDCRGLFSADVDPIGIAEEMFAEDGRHGSFQFSADLHADAETRPVEGSARWNATTEEWLYSVVNVVFNSGTASGYWLQTTDKERGRMLVHELGHVFMYRFGKSSTRFVRDDTITDQLKNQDLEKLCFPD